MPKWYGGSTLNPDELIPKKDQWTEQWRRVTRWFRRSEKIKKKAEVKELDEGDIDVLIAFFQNCYHLRDWISDSRPDLKPKLDRFFEQHFEMRTCRNICDGYKHKRLTSGKHPDPDFNLYREYDYFQSDAEPSRSPLLYRIAFAYDNDIKKYDLFVFTEICFHLWEEFISKEMSTSANPE